MPAISSIVPCRTTRCSRPAVLALLALALQACTPALDWRDWRPEGSGVQLLLPCKPVPQSRKVPLGGQEARLHLHACSAGGQTWALAFADVATPERVERALGELRDGAVANIAGTQVETIAWTPPGATPHPRSMRLRLQGRLPDGKAVQEQVAVFAIGTVVLQVTALGEQLPPEALDTFFGSLRVLR